MNWNGRAAWVYNTGGFDAPKAHKYGIETIYLPGNDAHAADGIKAVRAAGLQPGLYFAKNWQNLGGSQFADWASKLANELLPRVGKAEAPPVMLDLETTDTGWVAECLARYRAHQPHRPTSYTNAPFQGGYVPVDLLARYGIPVYVQLYYGGMEPADASAAILETARDSRWGTVSGAGMVHPFYDGARESRDQRDGCYFTLERLP